MSRHPDPSAEVSVLARTLQEMKRMRAAIQSRNEPVAIVGMACRFPGADSPREFWHLLHNGVDAIREVPRERWDVDAWYDPNPDTPGKTYTRSGGFLDGVDLFDASLFRISAREAASMDPQHRVLLETSWEALEDAGVAPGGPASSRTGIFIGITTNDYLHLQIEHADRTAFDAYTATGNPLNFAAGRLSYLYGFQGPCMAVDAACASSLVSVHLACQSLRGRECDMALAGGVNLVLSPRGSVFLSRTRALAPDGRCKTFDASADGMSRSEGCGIVVLKRLSDAVRDGDNILASIRGSAVRQDGPSSGLTVPNGQAQQALIRAALENAGVRPAEVSYVEAHGTGTSLGDPIELRALASVMSEGRDAANPLTVGSVKTNIGHPEAAAGVAGLIKTVLALQHEEIPPHLHLRTPTPHVEWDRMPVVIPIEPAPWPAGSALRIAGVSAFGLSGTIAHVVLGEAPAPVPATTSGPERPLHVLTLSAKSGEALSGLAARHRDRPPDALESFADVCFTANTGRARLSHRLAIVAGSAAEARETLAGLAEGKHSRRSFAGRVEKAIEPKVAFLFTGQGSQYLGMGRLLYQTQPAFRQALERCGEMLEGHLDRPLLSVMYPETGVASLIDETAYTQPALFALEYALSELWRGWGVYPRLLAGHSVGEYVAACVAGIFSVEDGIRLVAERGRLMQSLARRGAMAAVFAPEPKVRESLAGGEGSVSIAAVNGPENVVISGEEEGIEEVVERLGKAGIRTQRLRVSHGFHSPLMDGILPAFRRAAEKVRYGAAQIPLVSNLTGQVAEAGEMENAAYWVRQLRETVQFRAGMETLREQGCEAYLEIGPKATLLGLGQQCAGAGEGMWLASLREERNDWEEMLTSLARLWVEGVDVQWDRFDRGYPRRRLSLPTYPFQRKRYWFETSVPAREAAKPAPGPGQGEPHSVDWLYHVCWERKPFAHEAIPANRNGRWVILADRSGVGEQLAGRLGKDGASSVLIIPPGEQLHASIREVVLAPDVPCRGVVYLRGLDASIDESCTSAAVEAAARLCCATALHLVQVLAASEGSRSPKLWFVTCGAQSVGQTAAPLSFVQSTLWGLGKVVGIEHPGLWGGLIDIDPADRADQAGCLRRELEYSDAESQIAYREGHRYVARLTRMKDLPAASGNRLFKAEGSYLITGGLGGVGLGLARWMVNRGARHLILVGRGAPSGNALAVLAGLERAGARILTVRADVSRLDELAAALPKAGSMPELKGVIHAAGVLADGVVLQQNWSRFAEALAPKVVGTWNLHQVTRDCTLDFFVLFSSASAVFGSPGQGNYAAANAFMDAFAEFRHARGLPAVSVNWGPWAEAGMAVSAGSLGTRVWDAGGMSAVPPETGAEILGRIIESKVARAAVLPMEWDRFLTHCPEGGLRSFVSGVTGETQPLAPPFEGMGDLAAQLKAASPENRIALLAAYLRRRLAVILRAEAQDFPPDRSLIETGIDSLMVMEFLNGLKRDLSLTVYPREFYERPTIGELSRYLAAELDEVDRNYTPGAPAPPTPVVWKPTGSGARHVQASSERLPGIVFLLSSPRAGSTLLRVMMAGHPALFCPPELHLLPFDTMAERREALASGYFGEGLERAFMELGALDAEQSKSLANGFADSGLSTRDVYGLLRKRIPGRLMVDKSPSYAASLETLARAEALFDRPRYIHLIRHPYAVIESFVRNRFQRLIPGGRGDPYDIAEEIWTTCNGNVLQFLATVDPGRRHVVRYEELVADPAPIMRSLCRFLDIPFDEAVLKPYEGNRMTDGIHPQSLSIGDPGFLGHQAIEPALGDAWRSIRLPRRLRGSAQCVAAQLVYPLPNEVLSAASLMPARERFLNVRGLSLCICEWGPDDGAPVLCLHGILDQAAAWEPVAAELAQSGLRVIAVDLRGHGLSGHAASAGSYHLLDFLGDIDAVVQSLGERPLTLVGHSMGALLAAMFAGARPKSVGRLVLIECPSPDGGKAGNVPKLMATQLDYLALRPEHAVLPDVAAAAARLRQATPSLPEDLATRLARRITEPCGGGVRWRWDARLQTRTGIAFHGIDSLNLSGYHETLRSIQAPVTLVYADSSDFVGPEQMAATEASLAVSRRVVLPGGHNLHIDAWGAVADVIALSPSTA